MFTLTGSLNSMRQSAPLSLTTVWFFKALRYAAQLSEFKCPQECPGDFFKPTNKNFLLPLSTMQ